MGKNTNAKLNAIENEMAEMNATPETMEEVITSDAVEPEKTAEELLKEKERSEKEARKQAFILALENKLKLYPRKLTIKELIAFRQFGIESWLEGQRRPSHTPNDALAIIDSALQGIPCGVITLGVDTETGELHTINGSSRIDDFIAFYTGKISRKDNGYKDLPKETIEKFKAFELSIDWVFGTKKELIRDFKNLNNDVSLTGGQKAFTNLVGTSSMNIVNQLNTHAVFNQMFSARQVQKQEANNCIFLILANITGTYNAKIGKVTENLASVDFTEFDVDKMLYIFDKLHSADVELSKFKFIHLAHLMYIQECWKSKNMRYNFEIDEIDDNAISMAIGVNYSTAGTNSADVNATRIEGMARKLYIYFKGTAPQAPKTAKQAEDTLDPDTL